MALTQENVHYTLNSGPGVMNEQVEQGTCADPGIFVRRGGGGRGPTARKQSGQCLFSHQHICSLQSGSNGFITEGRRGSNFFQGVGVSKETHITCDFPGGSGHPNTLTPLWVSIGYEQLDPPGKGWTPSGILKSDSFLRS